MAVSEDDTDLGGSGTLTGELADVVDDGVGRALEPGGDAARVGDGGRGNTLALAVKTTHVGGIGGTVVDGNGFGDGRGRGLAAGSGSRKTNLCAKILARAAKYCA